MDTNYYDSLTVEQVARWISLLLAVDQIDEYCEQYNKPFNDEVLKPIAIKHYIREKSKSVQSELNREIRMSTRTNFDYLKPKAKVATPINVALDVMPV